MSVGSRHKRDPLIVEGTERNDHGSAGRKLIEKRGVRFGGGGGDKNAIEEPVAGPSPRAVAVDRRDIMNPEPLEPPYRQIVQFSMAFDGVNVMRDP